VGRIQVLPETDNADWRVKPIWPVSLPFKIVYVDPDYRYVLFGEQNRSWGWLELNPLTEMEDPSFQVARILLPACGEAGAEGGGSVGAGERRHPA
jgi:hypothetical protein